MKVLLAVSGGIDSMYMAEGLPNCFRGPLSLLPTATSAFAGRNPMAMRPSFAIGAPARGCHCL